MSAVASPVRIQFRAMGTDCEVVIHGGPSDLEVLAEAHVRELDEAWSRFRADSELMQLNGRAGTGPVPATTSMRVLVRTMVSAWQITQGLCDASVHDAIVEAGYDADFDAIVSRGETSAVAVVKPLPGLAGVEVGRDWVSLPDGVHLDSGALGKGLGADLVAARLIAAGAIGCAVNLGGDVVVAGQTLDDTPWLIAINDSRTPGADALLGVELPSFGAVATSSTLKRRWGSKHHIIDPRTGDCSDSNICQATIIANSGWWAEAAATAVLLLGADEGVDFMKQHDLHGILLTTDNSVLEV